MNTLKLADCKAAREDKIVDLTLSEIRSLYGCDQVRIDCRDDCPLYDPKKE